MREHIRQEVAILNLYPVGKTAHFLRAYTVSHLQGMHAKIDIIYAITLGDINYTDNYDNILFQMENFNLKKQS